MYMARFHDPEGTCHGIPTFNFRCAPSGYATKRQLAAQGLRPGETQPAAQIVWRRGRRVAYLYTTALAEKKTPATPGQLRAVAAALAARRTCGTCRVERPYYIPTRYGECLDCVGVLLCILICLM